MVTPEQAKKISWYKQSGAGTALLLYLPLRAVCDVMFDRTSLFFPNQVAIFMKGEDNFVNFYHYFDYDLTLNEVKKVFNRLETEPEFFQKEEKDFYNFGEEILALGHELQKINDPVELAEKFKEYLHLASQFWGTCLFIDLLDPYEEEIIKFVFGNELSRIEKKDLGALFSPNELSIGQSEQIDFLKIVKAAKVAGIDSQKIANLLEEHSKKYFFISNDYETIRYLGKEYFKEVLKKKLTDLNYEREVNILLERFNQAILEKQNLIKKYALGTEIIQKLEFFNWVTNFRDQRKKYTQISSYFAFDTISKIAKSKGFSDLEVKFLLPTDLNSIIETGKVTSISDRVENGVMFVTHKDEAEEIIFDQSVKKVHLAIEESISLSEIKGNSASRGKTIGQAKVIMNQGDFSKMEAGDILVAPMTRPEYVPVMKLAKAIITDEGGITCHAAIVSRELGIPCITGTQVATKVLRDGYMIDVDANHGLIKIINGEK